MEIDFKITYFIAEGAYINEYLDRSDEYFEAGDIVTFFTEMESDIARVSNQGKLSDFNEKLQESEWVVAGSFESWFDDYKSYVNQNSVDSTITI